MSAEAQTPTLTEKAEVSTPAPTRGRLARLLGRADDLLNPIVVKELRQAVKSRVVVTGLLVLVILQVFVIGLFLAFRSTGGFDLTLGSEIFLALQGILVGTCLLLIPAYAGVRIAAERSDTNVDLLFISTLKPRAIMRGKFLSAVVLTLAIFSACAPFMTFTYLLRGLDIPTILFILTADFLAVLGGTMLTLFLGAIPTSWPLKVGLLLVAVAAIGILFAGTMYLSWELLQRMGGVPAEMPEFWAGSAAVAAGFIALIGLFYFWSVAVISPPATNRMLPVRIYLLAAWVLTAVAMGVWSRVIDDHVPVQAWLVAAVGLLALQLLVSVNERDHWGSRVARTIPRSPPGRLLAFLFYSGSAGGVAFSFLLTLASFVAAGVWHGLHPTMDEYDTAGASFLGAGFLFGFTLAYSLTAALVRGLLLREHIRHEHTWILALLFLGLGCTLPFIAAYAVYDEFRFPRHPEWWLWGNPFAAVHEVFDRGGSNWDRLFGNVEDVAMFLGAWCLAALVASVPWFLAQAGRFRPSERSQ